MFENRIKRKVIINIVEIQWWTVLDIRSCLIWLSFVIYALLLKIQLSRGDGLDHSNWFNPVIFVCACPRPKLNFQCHMS
jgi:hypothetical protein